MKKFLSCILAAVMLAFGLTSCSIWGGSGNDSQSSSTHQNTNTIEFVNTELVMEIGESVQAEVVTSKKNAPVFWSIRDAEIAKVSDKGVITALSAGETVCYAEFGGQTAMCLVTVKEQSATPELSIFVPYAGNKVSMYAGSTLALNEVVKFGDEAVTEATVEYTVADAQIATVSNGVINGLAVGETKVTITASYNGQVAEATVTVVVINTAKAIKAITAYGQRTAFTVGDKFVFDGFVDVEYTDGDTESKVDYYTVNMASFNSTKAGEYEIIVSVGDVSCTYTVTVVKATTLKILMIGNSFSQDTVMWMPGIAKSLGFTDIEVATLVIGGCTLETHCQNAKNNTAAYEFLYGDGESWTTTYNYTMAQGLKATDWDFVCLQQQSGNSGNVASYNSDLLYLVDYVKANTFKKDKVKLVWNMTWAYPTGSNWFNGLYDNDTMKMYNAITAAVQEKIVTNENFALISPAGTAIQNGRTSSVLEVNFTGANDATLNAWNRDGAHLSVYEGRFTSSLSMFCTVTGYTPDEITYNPANVDAIEARLIRESVRNALANPFAVTNSSY